MTGPATLDEPCRSADLYQRLNFIDEGTYGRVFRARDNETGVIYALKQVKSDKGKHGFPITALREITTLFSLSHPNIVYLREVVITPSNQNIFLVMEYAHHDLMALLDRMTNPFAASEIKALLRQTLQALVYMHRHWVLHRDLKPSNLLITDKGVLKICDFGLARYYSDPPATHTPGIVTLWYRAPEILLSSRLYTTAVDMWAVGCIFAELFLMKPLIAGKGELAQISEIAHMLGAPSEQRWKGFTQLPGWQRVSFRKAPIQSQLTSTMKKAAQVTDNAIDLISKMLEYDPQRRISAAEALVHPYFSELPPPKHPSLIQTFPDRPSK